MKHALNVLTITSGEYRIDVLESDIPPIRLFSDKINQGLTTFALDYHQVIVDGASKIVLRQAKWHDGEPVESGFAVLPFSLRVLKALI